MSGARDGTDTISEAALRRIVECGIQAPSGDNCQPWGFRWREDKLELLNDTARGSHFFNKGQEASWIALGAVLENMRIAARALGYETREEHFPRGARDSTVARVGFARSADEDDLLFPFLSLRCTNRKPYRREKLSHPAREALRDAARSIPGGELHLAEGAGMDKLAMIAARSQRVLLEIRSLHADFFRLLRWNLREIEGSRDGLDIRTLELGKLDGRVFRLLKSWLLVRSLGALGLRRMLVQSTYKIQRQSSAIGLIQMTSFSPDSFLLGGRCLQRVWLTASANGLAFQPLFGALALMHNLRQGGEGLSRDHERLARDSESEIRGILPLDRLKAPIMLFRVGYASPPSARSLRRAAWPIEGWRREGS